ncbi:MAG TPA: carboxymuconolactone decarboxylase family protein [Thermoplasmata archaeon]|jgi:alkylhydroperoxidase family enzyme|nr:carboxymuconolactone decarboxylase family protein [Thermoplasmata archaeon]
MRLEPVEKPKGLRMRLAYWGMRRTFGKVMTPMKVLFGRMPEGLRASYEISKFELKGIHLEPELHYMLGILTSQINGCSFCADLGRSMALRDRLSLEKFNALTEYRTSPFFSARERAALAYAEEATRFKRVSDATFEELRKHFTEREIAEITWINAVENYYNLLNIPLEIGSDGFCALVQAKSTRAPFGERRTTGTPR